jgi:hypothetical protein
MQQSTLMRVLPLFVALALGSCKASVPLNDTSDEPALRDGNRKITGVLTLYTEGGSFQECSLREPWNCHLSPGPECAFNAGPDNERAIDTAVENVGAHQGFATFGVVMIGTRVDGTPSGHLGRYNCEFHALTVLKIAQVPSVPPAA